MSEEFAWSYLMWRCHFCQHQKRYSKDGVSHDHVAWKNLTQGAGMPIHQDCHMMWNREKVCWTKVGMPWCDGKPGEHAYIGGGGWSPMQRLRFVFFLYTCTVQKLHFSCLAEPGSIQLWEPFLSGDPWLSGGATCGCCACLLKQRSETFCCCLVWTANLRELYSKICYQIDCVRCFISSGTVIQLLKPAPWQSRSGDEWMQFAQFFVAELLKAIRTGGHARSNWNGVEADAGDQGPQWNLRVCETAKFWSHPGTTFVTTWSISTGTSCVQVWDVRSKQWTLHVRSDIIDL